MPTDLVQFLTVDEVLEIHRLLIEHFGGPVGVRDLGLLESALYRPQTGHYQDLPEMATALFESLLMNPPFVGGNKRIAFFSTDVFLRLNGYGFCVEPDDAHKFLILLLNTGQADFAHLLPGVRRSMQQIRK